MRGIAILFTALLGALPARSETLPGPFAAEVLRVIDGDTFEARIRLWLGLDLAQKVRVAGIDAPELAGPCAESGRAARRRTEELLAGPVVLTAVRPDKYHGRVVAEVTLPDGTTLAARLLAEGHAVPYGRPPCRR